MKRKEVVKDFVAGAMKSFEEVKVEKEDLYGNRTRLYAGMASQQDVVRLILKDWNEMNEEEKFFTDGYIVRTVAWRAGFGLQAEYVDNPDWYRTVVVLH